MIIGDSLAQGCRSLTVTAALCAQSWAARLAAEQQWPFVTPDYPREILFDLEREIRNLPLPIRLEDLQLRGIVDRIRSNLREWLNNAHESAFPCFDNLGLSGALIRDLYSRTAATSAAEIQAIAPNGADALSDIDLVEAIPKLHLPINARFTLNPAQDPANDNFTPLDWVRLRKPNMLFVQIGHNHGLYDIGSNAVNGQFDRGDFWDEWQTLATQLAQLPADITTILVTMLPKVGAVANLAPEDEDRTNGYADMYDPVLSVTANMLAGPDLAAIDTAIRAGNERIKAILTDAHTAAGADPNRLQFLRVYEMFDNFDYKNSLDGQELIPVNGGIEIDNRYISGKLHLLPPGFVFKWGGFESIDGMHPTGCGYAKLAADAIKFLNLQQSADLLQRGFDEDPLLSNYPDSLNAVIWLLRHLRVVLRLGLAAAPIDLAPHAEHLFNLLRQMQGIFTFKG
jgi:hypothetical protein